MALKFRRVKKAFGFDKSKTEKYVVVPERATPVSFDYLCDEIVVVSGINTGLVRATLFGLVRSMKTFIQQGHTVQVEGFGSFIPSFNAKSSLVEGDANADSIRKMKLRFVPCVELREMMNRMRMDFNDKDSTNDSGSSSEGGGDRPEIE
ncbi:hypothetical protein NXY11_08850 [Parabacteroides faecis]|uniref:HU family DNA-binding protein n=1 Tax=Parabacteroides faecis TaxID=1217282 RepID=UPI00216400A9|nr:hypothetical protein [Parabacteroides faecis]MCS2893077.1 hypothetical protein [Parabacteroides faecis]UVQ48313.1 hypothetical protein NXY11_08850 [Parabacteroides faecis]